MRGVASAPADRTAPYFNTGHGPVRTLACSEAKNQPYEGDAAYTQGMGRSVSVWRSRVSPIPP